MEHGRKVGERLDKYEILSGNTQKTSEFRRVLGSPEALNVQNIIHIDVNPIPFDKMPQQLQASLCERELGDLELQP